MGDSIKVEDNADGLTINGVRVGSVRDLLAGKKVEDYSYDEDLIFYRAARVKIEMEKKGYQKQHIDSFVNKKILNDDQGLGDKKVKHDGKGLQ